MASVSCQQAADRLVAAADDTGGRDNATAVVFEIGAVARVTEQGASLRVAPGGGRLTRRAAGAAVRPSR